MEEYQRKLLRYGMLGIANMFNKVDRGDILNAIRLAKTLEQRVKEGEKDRGYEDNDEKKVDPESIVSNIKNDMAEDKIR